MTQHVWHQGTKVTPFAGIAYRRHYGGYSHPYRIEAQREHLRIVAQRADFYRMHGPGTIGESTKRTTTVALTFSAWFRLLDEHGKPYGRRFHCTGREREVRGGKWYAVKMYQVVDQQGTVGEIQGSQRVRMVDPQPEDYHSFNSRVLTRAHRRLLHE